MASLKGPARVAGSVTGLTVALLGNLDARREMGKVGTQSDIHLHDRRVGDRDITTIVPARYPEQLKCLSYAVVGADAAVLVVDELNARIGEQILAAHAAGIRHGAIVLENYIQPEQIKPLLAGTTLESWTMTTEPDWGDILDHIAAAPVAPRDGFVAVPVDHHFDVKGVGAVILGVVQQGTLRKGETLYAWPDKAICPVRSIQIHDADHAEAVTGDRVGLALRNVKADQLDRGQVLAPADAPLQALRSGDKVTFQLSRSKFSKQDLKAGSVVHVGLGMQFAPLRLETDAPAAGGEAQLTGTLEKGIVVLPGQRGILWHVDASQRVVGSVEFAA